MKRYEKSLALILVSAMLLSMLMVGVSAGSKGTGEATPTIDGAIAEGEYAKAASIDLDPSTMVYYYTNSANSLYGRRAEWWLESNTLIGASKIYVTYDADNVYLAGFVADTTVAANAFNDDWYPVGAGSYRTNANGWLASDDFVAVAFRTEAAKNGIGANQDPGDEGGHNMIIFTVHPFTRVAKNQGNRNLDNNVAVTENWLSNKRIDAPANAAVVDGGYTFEVALPRTLLAGLTWNGYSFPGLDQFKAGGKLYTSVILGDGIGWAGHLVSTGNEFSFGDLEPGQEVATSSLHWAAAGMGRFGAETRTIEFKDPAAVEGGTPTIDGAIAAGEYDAAGKISLPASNNVYYYTNAANSLYGRRAEWWLESNTLIGDSEIYINRDADNLYIAGFIADTTIAFNAYNDDWYPVGAGSYRTGANGWLASDDFVAVALRTEAAKGGIGANQDPGDEGGHNMVVFTVHPFTRVAKNQANRNLDNSVAVTENWLTDKRIAATAEAAVVAGGYTFEVAIPFTIVNNLSRYDVKFGGLDQFANGKLYTSVILGDGIGWAGHIVATGNEFSFGDLEPGQEVATSDLHWAASGLGKFGAEERFVTFKTVEQPAVKENEVAATCLTDATYESVVYTNYGEEVSRTPVTVENSALGHDLVHHDAQEATCTEIGWDAYDTCSRCDYTTYAEIAALGHDFTRFVLDGGYAYKACSRCDVVGEIAAPYTGVIKVEDDFYYVDAASAILTDTVKNISDAKANGLVDAGSYIIDAEGKIVIADGLVGENFYTNGAKAPSYAGLVSDGTYVYFVDKNAEILRGVDKYVSADKLNGLATTAGWYRIDADGHVLFDTLVDERGYVYVEGVRAAAYSGVVKVGDDFYYVDAEGLVVKGISKYVSKTNDLLTAGYYIIADDGKIQVGNFINDDYVYINGIRITESYYGLVQVGDDYYYVNNNAKIFKNGTKYVNKVNGLNFKRGNYTFDADGKLVIA